MDPVPCETLGALFLHDEARLSLEEGVFFDECQELLPLLRKLRRLYLTASEYQDLLLEACLVNLLVVAKQIQERQNGKTRDIRSGIDWNEVIDLIDERYQEDVDFDEMAQNFHYSYSRFRHLFTERFSVSPQGYLIARRLEHAKTLLEQTSFSLTEIAYNTGFSTPSNFSKAFQKHYGVSPKAYRNGNR